MKDNKPYRQNKVFDNISETEEFNVYTKIDDLPLNETPAYLEEGINGICTGGSALFNVFGNKRRIVPNDLVVIFPFMPPGGWARIQTRLNAARLAMCWGGSAAASPMPPP